MSNDYFRYQGFIYFFLDLRKSVNSNPGTVTVTSNLGGSETKAVRNG